MYNLDHEAAIDTFTRVIDARPDDPVAYRSVAATIWLRILFLRGAVLVDNYLSGSISRPSRKVEKPPDDLDLMFEQHVERAIELSEAAVRQAPDDVDVHYELVWPSGSRRRTEGPLPVNRCTRYGTRSAPIRPMNSTQTRPESR